MLENRGAGVHLTKVSRTFNETAKVVDDLSLSIAPGEFVALLGPSGCGKSTLLRMIAGLDRPDQGDIEVSRESKRGFVFQDASLLPWRTALDNVALPLQLQKSPGNKVIEKAEEALVRVGLGDALQKLPSQLSGGMKMRVSLARALVNEPGLLLLDEPFAALDEGTRFALQEDLRGLWKSLGMTVIFVTHSISEAVFLADRLLVFSPRPARIKLDHSSGLSKERVESLRTSAEYVNEMSLIRRSFFDTKDREGRRGGGI